MLNRQFISWILFILLCNSLSGQKNPWTVIQYSDQIIQFIYQPENYHTNENISDAVILKPDYTTKIEYELLNQSVRVGTTKPINIAYISGENDYKGFRIQLQDNESMYGGGERALPLNRRGYAFNLHNNPWYGYGEGADNLNFSVPFFTSSRGYGLFFDNPSSGKVDIAKTNEGFMDVIFSSGQLNFFVIFGNNPSEILSHYHALTGRQGLPPRWTMGNFMSRFGYTSEAQIDNIASKMENERIPFDGIIIDLFWFGDSIKGTMGNLEWVNKSKWPDPAAMIAKYKQKNIKTILITEPFVLKNTLNYENSLSFQALDKNSNPYVLQDFYFGKGGLIDIFKNDAKDWFWSKHDEQNKLGVAAWWGDLGEPEKHPKDMYHDLRDLGFNRLFSADEVHNIYGHFWTKMLYQKYNQHYPNTRLFSLNRSGYAGSQRYNIIPWSGDVSRSWSGLRAQLPVILGMSMSGIPYIHADAGGFAGGDGDYSLYVRWLQFSAFTPIFRPHGTALFDIEPAAPSYPSEPALIPDPYKNIAADIVRLRYKMLPYNYTLSYQQAMFANPLIAPLYYYFNRDTYCKEIEDEFFWGKNILVAPILFKDIQERNVYLPEQYLWYPINMDFKSKKPLNGHVTAQARLDEVPVYVKEGSFIPLIDKIGKTSEDYNTDTLTVHYFFSDKESSDVMFEDDGLSKNSLQMEAYELISFNAKPSKNKLKIDIVSQHHQLKSPFMKRHIKMYVHGIGKIKRGYVVAQEKKKKLYPLDIITFDFDGTPTSIYLEN